MKGVVVIENRARLLLQQELDRRIRESQDPLPTRCKYNHRQTLDHRKTVGGEPNSNYNRVSLPVAQTMGLCLYQASHPEDWSGTICEDPIDAKSCAGKLSSWPGAFTPKDTPQDIYRQFLQDLKDEEWVLVNLPRIQPLLWVLGARCVVLDEPESKPEPEPELKFFQRLWLAWCLLTKKPAEPPPKSELKPKDDSSADLAVYLPPPPQ